MVWFAFKFFCHFRSDGGKLMYLLKFQKIIMMYEAGWLARCYYFMYPFALSPSLY